MHSKTLIKSFLNKDKNHYYYKIFLEKCSYQLAKKITKSFPQYNNVTIWREKSNKRPTKILDVNVDNIVISKLIGTKCNSQYFIGYLDKDIRSLVLIVPKMSGYIKVDIY